MTAPGDFFRCIDSNECSQDVAACEEGRVCLDLRGGFRCVAVEEQCTQANNFGGCYVSDLAPVNGGPRSACVSRVSEFRARAAGGDVSVDGAPTFNCSCAALPCHTGDGVTCSQLCPLEECLNRNNPAISTCVIAPESRAQPPPRLCACARVACSCAAAMQSSCVAIALERSACGTQPRGGHAAGGVWCPCRSSRTPWGCHGQSRRGGVVRAALADCSHRGETHRNRQFG